MPEVSLTAKNPFMMQSFDVWNLKNWFGVFLFALVAGGFMIFYKMITPKTTEIVGKSSGLIGEYLGQVL